jgi:hypothetical protein
MVTPAVQRSMIARRQESQMLDLHASAIPALVMNMEALRNRAMHPLPSIPVGKQSAVAIPGWSTAIAVRSDIRLGNDATVLVTDLLRHSPSPTLSK